MVDFTGNACLNQKFEGNAMNTMTDTITNACGPDMEIIFITELNKIKESLTSAETIKTLIEASLSSQLENLKSSLISEKLEQELRTCKAEIMPTQNQFESSVIQLKEMREIGELKVQENTKLKPRT
jgi:hypothetical protein